jgi:hypothetical protein
MVGVAKFMSDQGPNIVFRKRGRAEALNRSVVPFGIE